MIDCKKNKKQNKKYFLYVHCFMSSFDKLINNN